MGEYLLKRPKRRVPTACGWPDEQLCLYRIAIARLLIWAMRRNA
ncbi:hypothetical protein [Sphingomonas sp. PR090111-T3T-6A]|nr:hypothetical protein [Sphingomonas sp. PR090111-T3T-6A]